MRKELLEKLKEARKELKEARLDLVKERVIDTIKITFISVPLILSGVFTISQGKRLFFDKEVTEPYIIERVYDNEGNSSTNFHMQDDNEYTNTLTTYSRYTQNDNGTYTREYNVYDISKTPQSKIKKCVDQNDLDIDVKKISSGTETTNKINEDENHYYMVVRTYEEDKEKTYTREKTAYDKKLDTGRFILSIALGAPALRLSVGLVEYLEPEFYQDDKFYREEVKEAKQKVKSIKKR